MNIKFFSGGLRKRGILKKDKNNLPLISIITVVLNNKKFLQQSINSVLNQSYKNYELIIIDGKSTDGTLDILKKKNSKIDYWISKKDQGIYAQKATKHKDNETIRRAKRAGKNQGILCPKSSKTLGK